MLSRLAEKREPLIITQNGEAKAVFQGVASYQETLAKQPERGNRPWERLNLGIREYRQVFFKPNQVMVQVTGERVIICLIVDGRRDMNTLLAASLLAAPNRF